MLVWGVIRQRGGDGDVQGFLVCSGVDMALDTRKIMLYSLPRTYNFTRSGQAVPDEPDPMFIGQNVQLDRLTTAIHTLKQRMQDEVFVPLTSWITAFTDVQVCNVNPDKDTRHRSTPESHTTHLNLFPECLYV